MLRVDQRNRGGGDAVDLELAWGERRTENRLIEGDDDVRGGLEECTGAPVWYR